MTRHLSMFIITFIIGAVIAVIVRTGSHKPYADHRGQSAADASVPTTVESLPAAVNSICALCGMPVDAALGTIEYKNKLIGFGCKACPAKFRAEPEIYGEAALKNQVVE